MDLEARLRSFGAALEGLSGKFYRAESRAAAREYTASLLAGKTAVASNSSLLRECGVTSLEGVKTEWHDEAGLRKMCSTAGAGITVADYALADTGSLVLFSSAEEARMISLLPPLHVAFVSVDQVLTGLDELFTLVPHPGERSSSMVLVTGPSRTADIEQILIRGVHGPGELHVIAV
jgi:L-lactate dehydrogenase complex protein LldG